MGERNPLLKYLQAAGLQAIELFDTDEVKIIDIVDDEFIDITDEADEYFVKDSVTNTCHQRVSSKPVINNSVKNFPLRKTFL